MEKLQKFVRENKLALLWSATALLLVGMLFARVVFSEDTWVTVVVGALLLAALGGLAYENRQTLKGRSGQYGINSVVTTLLVLALLGVFNYLSSRYPLKKDLTKTGKYTLSDQTVKVVKGLKDTVHAVVFAPTAQRDQFRTLLDNYRALNPKFDVEFVDPNREPTRARQAGLKKVPTMILSLAKKESKVEDLTEEKVTNGLIKLLKDKSPLLCSIIGHGEKSFASAEADGYELVKRGLGEQFYEVKDLNLVQEQNKIPADCSAIAILGPTKPLFAPEIKAVTEYFDNGGRGIVAVDINLRGGEYSPELNEMLASWHVKPQPALIVDPSSRLLGADVSVAVLTGFSKDNPITREFQPTMIFPFPISRPLEIVSGAPAGMNVQWLAQSSANSWAEADLKGLAGGRAQLDATDKRGPLNVAVAVEGKKKDSKATRNTRLVVFGTSQFAANQFAKFGGNTDFLLNAVSWVMEDENMISIRDKDDENSRVELTKRTGDVILVLTVFLIPLLVAGGGVVIWAYRRKL